MVDNVRRILLVEDEYFVADDLAQGLEQLGMEVLGPAATVRDALDLIAEADQLDGAALDINLRGEMVFPVADALEARHVPFVFVTGYDRMVVPPHHQQVARCEKPAAPVSILAALFPETAASAAWVRGAVN